MAVAEDHPAYVKMLILQALVINAMHSESYLYILKSERGQNFVLRGEIGIATYLKFLGFNWYQTQALTLRFELH